MNFEIAFVTARCGRRSECRLAGTADPILFFKGQDELGMMQRSNIPDWYFYFVIVYAGLAAGFIGWAAYGDGGMPLRYPIGLAAIFYVLVVAVSLWIGKRLFKAMDDL